MEQADEPAVWRRRHLEAVDRFREDEAQWALLRDALRRLASRLCIAARGQDEGLDRVLEQTSLQLRAEDLTAQSLESIESTLKQAILQMGDPPETVPAALAAGPVDAGTAPERSLCRILQQLIERLPPDALPEEVLESLQTTLARAPSLEALGEVAARLADGIAVRINALHEEKSRVEQMLQQVSAQLREVDAYFRSEGQAQAAAQRDGQQLDARLRGEVSQIGHSVDHARDLTSLRQEVRVRLDAIDQHLHHHRESESGRLKAWEQRMNEQRGRIEQLETEMNVMQQRLASTQRRALTDALTGIPNRSAYDQRLGSEIGSPARVSRPLCLVVLDVDFFKKINDQYGHPAGDKLLQSLGQHLQRCLREQDFAARYGGEEFVLLFDGINLSQGLTVADKLRRGVEKMHFAVRGDPVQVTVSAGLTCLKPGDTAQSVFERADRALYQAKQGGRNQCVAW